MAVVMFVLEVLKYSASFVVWMLSAWKSKASAVHEANPTMKKSHPDGDNDAKSENGFFSGRGLCHSVRYSPYSFVI